MVPFVAEKPPLAVRQPLQQRQTPRFGFAQHLASYGFGLFERYPLFELAFKDVTCFNLPKIATTRTLHERLDVATLEFSNTSVTVGSSLVLPRIIQFATEKIAGVPRQLLKGEIDPKKLTPAVKLGRLATTFGFLWPFALAFWAAAFFRNWLTLKRTKTANFEMIIGLKEDGQNQPQRAKKPVEPEAQSDYRQAMKYQMGMVKKVMGLGALLGLASLVGFGLAARNAKNAKTLSPMLDKLYKTYRLGGPGGNEIEGFWPVLIFWLSPAYLGWMHASRGKNEFREQAIKAGNSVLWFSVFNRMIVNPYFTNKYNQLAKTVGQSIPRYDQVNKLFKGPLRNKVIGLKNTQNLLSMAISIAMLSVSPSLLNIFLTKKLNKGSEPLALDAPTPLKATNDPPSSVEAKQATTPPAQTASHHHKHERAFLALAPDTNMWVWPNTFVTPAPLWTMSPQHPAAHPMVPSISLHGHPHATEPFPWIALNPQRPLGRWQA